MNKTTIPILVLSFILSACISMIEKGPRSYISQAGNIKPEPSSFVFCSKYGCKEKTIINLSSESWQSVRQIFVQKALDPAQEREQISNAIGLLETILGPITETENDEPGSFQGMMKHNQLDCVDESLNTTTYLVMLEEDNLITEHTLLGPAQRGFLIDGAWPHFAPVIEEKATGERFVVDSWFYKNGEKAVVLPLQVWKSGWKPEPETAVQLE
ncbi:hypothetical protein ACFLYW_00060 [Thermodesulfobacteriota bacterium]